MISKTKIGPLIVTLALIQPSFAIVANISSGQFSQLLNNNITQSLQAINNVQNQIKQIQQLKDQISLDTFRNDILGEYGLEDLADFEKTLDSFRDIGNVDNLENVLGRVDVDDIWLAQSKSFGVVKAPEKVNRSKYQSHAAAESAFFAAQETQEKVRKKNGELGKEAVKQREMASKSKDEATYQQHIDKAEAAEAAIDRNNDESQAAVDTALAMHAAAEMDDRKREKAENDRAREHTRKEMQEMSDAVQEFDFKIQ